MNKGNFLSRLKQKFSDSKISAKIMTFYCSLLIFSVLVSGVIYQNIYNATMSRKVSDVSEQTLYSISSNIDSMIENSKNLSKVIITSDEIQQPLNARGTLTTRTGGYPFSDTQSIISSNLDTQRAINSYVSRFIEAFPFIASIYIFDCNSQRYGIDKLLLKTLKIESIQEAPWYDSALKSQGGLILRLNADGMFIDSPGEKYISLIRVINNIYSQKPIGILIMNISEDAFAESYKDIINKYDTDIMIKDGEGQTVVDFRSDNNAAIRSLLPDYAHSDNPVVKRMNGKDYLISDIKMEKYDWDIISVMPFEELSKESAIFNAITIVIIALNSALLFLGSLIISRMITTPIKKLLKSMKGVEKGDFKKVDIAAGNDEIGKLQDAYNIMITEIQNLIHKLVEDQKMKRKAELDVLQAQIKPHFLYNTFDAISSLALSGQNSEVYRVMKALGSYYRISLSKGSEVITIAEEVEVVKNYMAIQQVRYGDIFTMKYDIDEGAMKYKILKLVLQPLVENALYHGIKPKGEQGCISISVKQQEENVVLSVEDDGVGMLQDNISRILDRRYNGDNDSFGLRGTIERLRIFYGVSDPVYIQSRWNEGTKVIITVPVEREL